MKLLLDTSGYIGFRLGIPDLVDFLSEAGAILVSLVVLGELMFGFRLGNRF
jgi:tRNA(fMet)-specific endonuclease VapC